MRPRVENQPNNRPACRSGRRRPSPSTLENSGNRAHHTEKPAAFTTAELGENALVLRRRFGLGWNLDLATVSFEEHDDNIPQSESTDDR
ncbi:hypothetical protein NDU88_006251 [Pleurodeles waltl]|uniref:Uncharacterized protein n=1 Tax=Pleurodeles waltl TaxID=8319 RepID=A0AAV7SPB5_PLEWA|nr:hypothetical protein NDU88_006251 [Pleurodeles waltl]